MYKVIEWSPNLDLDEFYKKAKSRGFENNSCQKKMIDCFRNEKDWKAWILYNHKNRPIGSVASHTFDTIVPDSFRVLTRVCTFAEERNHRGLITSKKLIAQHQNLTDQFLLPKCIEWVNGRGRIFATSNLSSEASQKLVHKYYFPTLEKLGIVSKYQENVYYRHTYQTVWEIFPDLFLKNLNKHPRWNELFHSNIE